MKKLGLVILILVLLLTPTAALAEEGKEDLVYTSIGDSFAYGLGGSLVDPANPTLGSIGYVDLLYEHFDQGYGNVTHIESYQNGLTSQALYAALNSGQFDAFVESADIITLSVGGGDLLPYVSNINPTAFALLTPEQQAIAFQGLIPTLENAIAEFGTNWSAVMTYINTHKKATAKVYVNTLFNPFKPGDGLYEISDPFVQGINAPIRGLSGVLDYEFVDVYTKFSEYNNPNKILLHNTYNTDPTQALLDPELAYLHPTDKGYKLIYNLCKDLME